MPCFTFDSLDLPLQINYLQIDTEGSELQILDSIDFEKYQIDYICIEDNLGYLEKDNRYEKFMNSHNFTLIHSQFQDFLYKKI